MRDQPEIDIDRAYMNGYRQAFLDWNAVLSTNGRITEAGYLALQKSLESVQARIKNAR